MSLNRDMQKAIAPKSKRKPLGVATLAARTEMLVSGISMTALAEAIGYDLANVSATISGLRKSWPIQKAINRHFGKQIFFKPARVHKLNPK